jgi:hypothetical protein
MAPLFKREKYSTLEHIEREEKNYTSIKQHGPTLSGLFIIYFANIIKWGAKYWQSSTHTAAAIYRKVFVSVRCYKQFLPQNRDLRRC